MAPRTCDVRGCADRAVQAIRLSPGDMPLICGLVCEEHRARIQGGAPVRWDPTPTTAARGVLVMGTEIAAAGVTITEVIAVEEHGLVLAPDGGPAVTLVLETLDADASIGELRVTMSTEVMDQIGSLFEAYWRRRPGGEQMADG